MRKLSTILALGLTVISTVLVLLYIFPSSMVNLAEKCPEIVSKLVADMCGGEEYYLRAYMGVSVVDPIRIYVAIVATAATWWWRSKT